MATSPSDDAGAAPATLDLTAPAPAPAAPDDLPAGLGFWPAIGLTALVGGLLLALLSVGLLGGGGSVVAAGGGAAPAAGGSTVGLVEAPAEGSLAPSFTLRDIDGKSVSLADYRGHPVWVNMWASWCAPCRAEMPEMQKLYARYKDAGLVLLGVDLGEDDATARSFVALNNYDWTFLVDADSSVGIKYRSAGIPTHAFIDAAGVIRAYRIGGLATPTMEEYLARIMPH